MALKELHTSRGVFRLPEEYKVILPRNKVNWTTLGDWCVKNLRGEVISDCGNTNGGDSIIWFFEYETDATLFALRWA